jgi:hypothetical protein
MKIFLYSGVSLARDPLGQVAVSLQVSTRFCHFQHNKLQFVARRSDHDYVGRTAPQRSGLLQSPIQWMLRRSALHKRHLFPDLRRRSIFQGE